MKGNGKSDDKNAAQMTIHAGLTDKCPKWAAGEKGVKGMTSVDSDAIRGGTAPHPPSLGGRTA